MTTRDVRWMEPNPGGSGLLGGIDRGKSESVFERSYARDFRTKSIFAYSATKLSSEVSHDIAFYSHESNTRSGYFRESQKMPVRIYNENATSLSLTHILHSDAVVVNLN